ncbi:MAG: fumarylacetoacetate hydrolase family protein [Gallionellaceae bacterium]
MTIWIRYQHDGKTGFGTLDSDSIAVHSGDMFAQSTPTGQKLALAQVAILMPAQPSKMICLWNNFHALAAKLEQSIPPEPLYFIKAPSSYLAHGETIRQPASYDGRVAYEGELGIVIGRSCANATSEQARAAIFGYTCINDVTALDVLFKDASFAQWTRAKSYDTFGVFGPVIATGVDLQTLSVRTLLNGRERQNYRCDDMIFSPEEIVRLISQDMTLLPGDVIACGTSLGVLPMKHGMEVSVVIDGVGTLTNRFERREQ